MKKCYSWTNLDLKEKYIWRNWFLKLFTVVKFGVEFIFYNLRKKAVEGVSYRKSVAVEEMRPWRSTRKV